jgi:hypothetical protein
MVKNKNTFNTKHKKHKNNKQKNTIIVLIKTFNKKRFAILLKNYKFAETNKNLFQKLISKFRQCKSTKLF